MSAFATSCIEPVPGITHGDAQRSTSRHRAWRRYRLVGFLLASGALHALLLLTPDSVTLPAVIPQPGAPPTIAARLLTPKPHGAAAPLASDANTRPRHSTHAPPARRARRHAPHQRTATTKATHRTTARLARHSSSPASHATAHRGASYSVTRPAPLAHTTTPASAHANVRGHTSSHASPSRSPRGAAVRAVVERAMQAHFYYPYVARRNGWQGVIDLGLRINADGRISNVHVIKSSGYGMLDRAALKSARSIHVLPKLVDLLYGHTVELVLPVHYRLYNG